MKLTNIALGIASVALIVPAMAAQTATTDNQQHLTINQRRQVQQQRIGQGVQNGSLTAGEAGRLERRETGLNREIRNMKSDGNFTPAERARVQRQQNRLSNQIYNQKHDAQAQEPANNRINARQRVQQQRIGQGIKNGSLTPAEASRLERREAGVERREDRMRASGGQFTAGERRAVNRQLNSTSRAIYRKKHNSRVR